MENISKSLNYFQICSCLVLQIANCKYLKILQSKNSLNSSVRTYPCCPANIFYCAPDMFVHLLKSMSQIFSAAANILQSIK